MSSPLQFRILKHLQQFALPDTFLDIKTPFLDELDSTTKRKAFKAALNYLVQNDLIKTPSKYDFLNWELVDELYPIEHKKMEAKLTATGLVYDHTETIPEPVVIHEVSAVVVAPEDTVAVAMQPETQIEEAEHTIEQPLAEATPYTDPEAPTGVVDEDRPGERHTTFIHTTWYAKKSRSIDDEANEPAPANKVQTYESVIIRNGTAIPVSEPLVFTEEESAVLEPQVAQPADEPVVEQPPAYQQLEIFPPELFEQPLAMRHHDLNTQEQITGKTADTQWYVYQAPEATEDELGEGFMLPDAEFKEHIATDDELADDEHHAPEIVAENDALPHVEHVAHVQEEIEPVFTPAQDTVEHKPAENELSTIAAMDAIPHQQHMRDESAEVFDTQQHSDLPKAEDLQNKAKPQEVAFNLEKTEAKPDIKADTKLEPPAEAKPATAEPSLAELLAEAERIFKGSRDHEAVEPILHIEPIVPIEPAPVLSQQTPILADEPDTESKIYHFEEPEPMVKPTKRFFAEPEPIKADETVAEPVKFHFEEPAPEALDEPLVAHTPYHFEEPAPIDLKTVEAAAENKIFQFNEALPQEPVAELVPTHTPTTAVLDKATQPETASHPFVDSKPAPALPPDNLPRAVPDKSSNKVYPKIEPAMAAFTQPEITANEQAAYQADVAVKRRAASQRGGMLGRMRTNIEPVGPILSTERVSEDMQGLEQLIIKSPYDEEKPTVLRWFISTILPVLGLIAACAVVWYVTRDV